MKSQKTIKTRSFSIYQNFEARKIELSCVITFTDECSETFYQELNLDIMPFEMAMQIVCSLINPTPKK